MSATRLLQRQILPVDRDFDVLPLYVDPESLVLDADKYEVGSNRQAQEMNAVQMRQGARSGTALHSDQIESRHAMRVLAGERLSFGTYFNAFPASYWRRWTVVGAVRLTVTLTGRRANLIVYKSMARGNSQRVASETVDVEGSATLTFDLTLKPFVDGGWYWYDVVAGENDVVVESAEWTAEVPDEKAEHGTVDIGITTMNRPDFCADLLSQLGDDADLRPYLDTVFVVEQGTDKVADSERFPKAEAALGATLRLIEQANLGGSGGYARGQLESVTKATATYFMCMDDDVVCEPEGVIRAVTFADLARRPTIVGGHMFNLYARSRMHSFGEIIQPWRFWWQSAPGVFGDWDFSARNLRSTRWMHQRVDVDFNGWFMCLIPRQVLEEVGLSLPLFIKWDDSEFGLRAKKAGYPTVTFPGAAVWHIPWSDKNDALDWQAYFHVRNRFIAALLHSTYPRGGRLVREDLNHTIAQLVSMQYSTVEIRHMALRDVLAGPDRLHELLPTRLSDVNTHRKQFSDAQLHADPDAFPAVKRTKPARKGREGAGVPTGRAVRLTALLAPLRQLKPPRALSRRHPEVEVRATDAKWYRLAGFDSAVVSMNDGTSAALYQRDPAHFRALTRETVDLHQQLWREWPTLVEQYRGSLAEITSPQAWRDTFARSAEDS